ncbi:MAG: hypothetical protein ACERKN_14980 [Velocimicrobium sp.]
MEKQTISLLKVCNSGCKSATNSMEQVLKFVKEEKLKQVIDKYNSKHIKLGEDFHSLLDKVGAEEEDPGIMAKTVSSFGTEVKLLMNDDSKKIAKLMMDGCNMGIQTISEALNKYLEASKESIDLAKRLIKEEEEFMKDLKSFL